MLNRFRRSSALKKRISKRQLNLEPLEARQVLNGMPVVSEFMAVNDSTLMDEDGEASDWIEIFNSGTSSLNLDGYSLSDDATNLAQWQFPPVELGVGEYLIVFASNKDRTDPESELHANFRLNSNGEYLALTAPDGTVLQEFSPDYPPQIGDVSYGLGTDSIVTSLLNTPAAGKALVPTDNSLENTWAARDFPDDAWSDVSTGIGFETGGTEISGYGLYVDGISPNVHWTFDNDDGTDSSPNNITAVPLFAGYADSLIGRALDLGKTNDFALVSGSSPNFADLRAQDELAIAGWIQKTGTTTGDVISLGDHYRLRLNDNDSVEFAFDNGDGVTSVTTDAGIAAETIPIDGQWHHVVAQKTPTGLEIWIDGVQSSNFTPTTTEIDYQGLGATMYLGRNGATSSHNVRAMIDDLAVWSERSFSPEEIVTLAAGGESPDGYTGQFESDLGADMFEDNASVYLRVPFQVDDLAAFNALNLDIQYDDGFVAYINGTEVARRNAPGDEGIPLPYDAAATDPVSDALAVQFESIDVSTGLSELKLGENILAIQGLNADAGNPDFLLNPTLSGALVTLSTEAVGYMTDPTPGELNNTASQDLGPIVDDVEHTPQQPNPGESVVVTARITETINPIQEVELTYRVMYDSEVSLAMIDDGTGADLVAGDGIYSAEIPGGVAQEGEMLRWYVTASDTMGDEFREPSVEFLPGSEPPPEYFGTMVPNPSVESELPIIYWFVENESAAGTDAGTRSSLWYNGEFYDNVDSHRRGGSTAGRAKTNFRFDFKGETFRFDENFGRVEEFALNSTYSDKAYIRQSLAFEAHDVLGAPGSISFPMHVQRNGEFYGVFAFIEEPDAAMLEREGLDPDGALYKFYNEFTSAGGARKKTRQYEDNTDLQTFVSDINRLRSGPQEDLSNYLFDNVNIPLTLNYLVATIITHQNDNPHKNHFLYRDSNITGEWMYIPWDHDLTWGSNWVGTSYSDVIYADQDNITKGPVPGHNNNGFIHPSHPFVNTEPYREWNNHWNRLMDAVLNEPRIREMFLRRLRTAMDDFLGSPDVDPDTTYFHQRLDYYASALEVDAAADNQRWPYDWGDRTQTAAEAIDIIKTDYLDVRRTHLYVTHNIDAVEPGGPELVFDEMSDGIRYFVPSDNSLGTTWTDVADPANIGDWQVAEGTIGYEDVPGDYDDLIVTSVRPRDTCAECNSIYVRIPFEISNADAVAGLMMDLRFDDGYVAYLNGTEVGRALLSGAPEYDSTTLFNLQHNAATYTTVDLSSRVDLLRDGTNILAIHSFNRSVDDDDQLVGARMFEGDFQTTDIAGIPNEQPTDVTLDFGEYDANPVSGNQDEEYIRIDNPMDTAIDLTGWRVDGGIEHEFLPGTVIEAGGSLYLSPDVPTFRARATGPSGGQGLFVQGAYKGHLSSFGDEVSLFNRDNSVIATLSVPPDTTSNHEYLRVTEVNYNPGVHGAEFIELSNLSDAEMLDLSGVSFSSGFATPFVFADGTALPPTASILVVQNSTDFQAAYPEVPASLIAGQYVGSLNNGGERIKLDHADGSTIMDFSYSDNSMWPQAADGGGASLVLIDPIGSVPDLEGKGYSWRSSTINGGTPGSPAVDSPGVVIHKVLSNTDSDLVSDTIVLHNPTMAAIDVSGWSLSDSSTPKYVIPANTMIAAGGYLTFDESNFNPTPATPEPSHFALDGAHGDDVWLLVPTTDGSRGGVDQIVDDVHFGAAVADEWFGRDSRGVLYPDTNGSTDAFAPRPGELILSEVNYNPGVASAAAKLIDQHVSAADLEYVEIYNPTSSQVDLTNWRLRGGIDENFAAGTTIEAGEALVVLSFNPEAASNSNRLAAFKTHYGLSDDVRLIGGYGGRLGDGGDFIRLRRPDSPPIDEPEFIPHTLEDHVFYDDVAPWPESVDGGQKSLTRVSLTSYGNVASSWIAADHSPGRVDFSNVPGDFTGDGLVMADDIDVLLSAIEAGQMDDIYDLDNSGAVDSADGTFLVENILGTFMGDANLDGIVDAADLNAVGLDWLAGGTGWASGDFTGDRQTDAADLNVIGLNWRQGAAPAAAARPPRAALAIRAGVAEAAFVELSNDAVRDDIDFAETQTDRNDDRLTLRRLRRFHADRYRRLSGDREAADLAQTDEAKSIDNVFAQRDSW